MQLGPNRERIAELDAKPNGGLMAPLTAGMLETIIEDIADVAMANRNLHAAIQDARTIIADEELCHVPTQARQLKALLDYTEIADCISGRGHCNCDGPTQLTLFIAQQWLWIQVTARVRQKWVKEGRD